MRLLKGNMKVADWATGLPLSRAIIVPNTTYYSKDENCEY